MFFKPALEITEEAIAAYDKTFPLSSGMAGYLDAYGVVDARRERLLKRIAIWGLPWSLPPLGFMFRNWPRRVFHVLKDKNYQSL